MPHVQKQLLTLLQCAKQRRLRKGRQRFRIGKQTDFIMK